MGASVLLFHPARSKSLQRFQWINANGEAAGADFNKWSKKGHAGQLTESELPEPGNEPVTPQETQKTMEEIQCEYARLLPLWQEERKEFGVSSNTDDYWQGPHGKAIIELGPAIIPRLIKELRSGDFFFNVPVALITKIDIAAGKIDIARGKIVSEQDKAKMWIESWEHAN